MLTAEALPPLPPYLYGRECGTNERVYTADQMHEYARAIEQAAYERAAAHVRTLKRDLWYLRVAPEIVVEECEVAIEKLMMQEQPE